MISKKDVQKLTDLALISISDEEADSLAHEFDAILSYVSEVKALANKEEHVREVTVPYNVMRDDVVCNKADEYTQEIIQQAPNREGRYVRVKKVL